MSLSMAWGNFEAVSSFYLALSHICFIVYSQVSRGCWRKPCDIGSISYFGHNNVSSKPGRCKVISEFGHGRVEKLPLRRLRLGWEQGNSSICYKRVQTILLLSLPVGFSSIVPLSFHSIHLLVSCFGHQAKPLQAAVFKMSYPNAVFSAFAFIGFVMCAIPLPWHIQGIFSIV